MTQPSPRTSLLLFIVLGLVLLSSPASGEPTWRSIKKAWPKLWVKNRPCKVHRVIDGDTVHVRCDGKKEKLRLVGIDTPETKHPFKPVEYYGPEASAHAKKLMLPGSRVWLAYGRRPRNGSPPRGRYRRILAYLFLPSGKMFNALMIRRGFAFAMRRYPHTYMQRFVKIETRAKRARRGMWQDMGKVRAMVAGDKAYRRQRKACRRKLGRGRFNWVIGDRQKRYFFTRRHRAFFRTNPYTRVLFCSVSEAKRAGYRSAPRSYRPRRPKSSYTSTTVTTTSEPGPAAMPSGSGKLVIADTNAQTFRVYRAGSYRIFRSARAAKRAGFRRIRSRRRRARGSDGGDPPPRARKRRRRRRKGRRSRGGSGMRASLQEATQKCGSAPVVGNRRSKVYRSPGQRSYKRATRSKNAIYFCSEKAALQANYRKAKR